MAGFSKQTTNRILKTLPDRALIGERTTAAARQRIHPSLPARFTRGPAAVQQTALLEAMQGGINGAFRQIECATAAVANFLNNGVAVGRPVRQRGEHDHVKMTFEHFAFH
jgi:hypothetical protein